MIDCRSVGHGDRRHPQRTVFNSPDHRGEILVDFFFHELVRGWRPLDFHAQIFAGERQRAVAERRHATGKHLQCFSLIQFFLIGEFIKIMFRVQRDQFAFFAVILHDLAHLLRSERQIVVFALLTERIVSDLEQRPFDRHAVFVADHVLCLRRQCNPVCHLLKPLFS